MRKALRHPFASALEFRRGPNFGRFWRYSLVSLVSTVVSLGGLYLFFRVLHIGSAAESNLIATSIASVPAYYLNRTWSWGKTGRSHVFREVVPFWAITAFGIIASTIVVHYAADAAYTIHHSHHGHIVTIVVEAANLGTYAVLWVGKFLVFNRYLFKSAEPVAEAVPTGARLASEALTASAAVGVAPAQRAGESLSGVELS